MPRGITPTGPDPTFDSRVEDIVRRLVRAEIAQLAGPAEAEALAQNTGRGLGIQNIRRGVLWETLTSGSFAVTTGATFIPWDTPLEGEIFLSGRPLLIVVSAVLSSAAGGYVHGSVSLRGDEVTGAADGFPGLYQGDGGADATGKTGLWIVPSPDPGPAKIACMARGGGTGGTVNASSSDPALLLAVEL